MEKVIKIQSDNDITNERFRFGDQTNLTKTLVDFKIPNNGAVYDLSKSYVSINFKVENGDRATPPTAIGAAGQQIIPSKRIGVGIRNDPNGMFDHSNEGGTTQLVKDCHIYSQKKGMIESIRSQDILNLGKRYYEKDDIELQQDLDKLAMSDQSPRGVGGHVTSSYFLDEVRVSNGNGYDNTGNGKNVSRMIDRDVKIHLKHLFGIGKAPLYSTAVYGETQIHLNLENLKKVEVATLQGEEAALLKAGDDQNGLAGGALVTTVTMSKQYEDPEYRVPFFVGEACIVTGTGSQGSAVLATAAVIKDITYDPATKKITLSFNNTIMTANAAGENLTNLVVTPERALDVSVSTGVAELNLVEVVGATNVPSQIDYITYSTETISAPGNNIEFNKQAKLEPNCQTLYIANLSNGHIAPDRQLHQYQLTIDGVDQTGNRPIVIGQPIHRDRIIRAYRNKNVPLKNLNLVMFKENATDNVRNMRNTSPNNGSVLNFLVEPIQLSNNEKNLQLKLTGHANGIFGHGDKNIETVILFKELVKSI
jgi:hypothetical protein